ncbi:MAG: histidine kinase [Paraglaciecola sp.]|nr:histidine kinase [Paraglaciecola sp.]NCT49409.1 histidine kinase [Paraglaciecola sp.]
MPLLVRRLSSFQLLEALPLLAALLLDSTQRLFVAHGSEIDVFVATLGQLLVEVLPLVVCHFLVSHYVGWQALFWFVLGFVIYPLLSLMLQSQYDHYAAWALFDGQSWSFLCLAAISWQLNKHLHHQHSNKKWQWLSRLLSLNSVVAVMLLVWATGMAGVFVYTPDPMVNQPLQPIIDFGLIAEHFALFLEYLSQFLCLAALLAALYLNIRYLLIRQFLAKHGLVAFVLGALCHILVLTPLFCQLALYLPLNVTALTLIPSGDHNIFHPINYQISFLLLAICVPLILAFERQQQDKAMADIARQQIRTELQLLQQQINPHFLFNTLNNLYALSLNKSDDAPELLRQLADLLHYTVYKGQQSLVPLDAEIAYLKNYLALQQLRSHHKNRLHCDWPTGAENWQIPPLLLIIPIENMYKHAAERMQQECEMLINLAIVGQTLRLTCRNSLAPNSVSNQQGIGLENLQRRLTLLFPGRHLLSIEKVGEQWHTHMELVLSPC